MIINFQIYSVSLLLLNAGNLTSEAPQIEVPAIRTLANATPGLQKEMQPTGDNLKSAAEEKVSAPQVQVPVAQKSPVEIEIETHQAKVANLNLEIEKLNQVKKLSAAERSTLSKLVEQAEFYQGEIKVLEQKKVQAEKERSYAVKKAEYELLKKKAEEQKQESLLKRQAYEAQLKARSSGSQTATTQSPAE